MSTITFELPGIDTQYFCATQTVATGAYAILNGTGVADTPFPYQEGGYYRNVSFTSPDDLSGVTLVINGSSINGTPITESISGPNATTVYTTQAFSRVVQIQATVADATNLSVGSGDTSVIPYQFGQRANGIFSCGPDSFAAYITNPDSVNGVTLATYRNINKGEIMAQLNSPTQGVFQINSFSASYRFNSDETRAVDTVYFLINSVGSSSIFVDIFTA